MTALTNELSGKTVSKIDENVFWGKSAFGRSVGVIKDMRDTRTEPIIVKIKLRVLSPGVNPFGRKPSATIRKTDAVHILKLL